VLGRCGEDVLLLVRRESLAPYPGRLRVASLVLGDFEVAVPGSSLLEQEVDVLWVATKATQLEQALALAPPETVGAATVVPLLNGVDHIELLRRRYRNVVGAAIRVESERIAAGQIEQKSPFIRLDIAGLQEVQATLRDAGIDCRSRADETSLLWEKLVFLAPVALATSAFAAPLGNVRDEPVFAGCRDEAAAAAREAGATIDLGSIRALHEAAPAEMRSSMQKDVAAGREPELAAIAGPILRRGDAESTELLVDRITARLD
jgi:2-dehydropantoate 2-reductase